MILNELSGLFSSYRPPTAISYTDVAALATTYFKLDETTATTTAANAGTDADGTYTNMVASDGTTTSIVNLAGSSMVFASASSEHVVGPAVGLGDTDQSIACAFKTTDAAGYVMAFRDLSVGSLGVFVNASGFAQIILGDQLLGLSGGVVNDGAAHHVALTFDASEDELKLYIDGALTTTDDGSAATITSGKNLMLACRSSTHPGTAYHLDCTLDEVMAFPLVLSASQVSVLASVVVGGGVPEEGYYVDDATGVASGPGDINNPWTLAYALAGAGGTIVAGDTVWLRAGTHSRTGVNNVTMDGSSGNPITFRGYPGERAIFDMHNSSASDIAGTYLYIDGDYLIFRDLEFTSTSTSTRYTTLTGSTPAFASGVHRGSIYNVGSYNKFIHNVIHDITQGFNQYSNNTPTPVGTEVYGNIVYNNGWLSTDGGHGHGAYFSHDGSGGESSYMTYKDNIVFSNFGFGLSCWGGGETPQIQVRGVKLIGNVWFYTGAGVGDGYLSESLNQEVLVGKTSKTPPHSPQNAVEDIFVTENYVYSDEGRPESSSSREVEFGWNAGSCPHNTITLTDNYFASRLYFFSGSGDAYPWTSISASGNSVVRDAAQTGYVLNGNTVASGITVVTDKTTPSNPTPFVRVDDYDTGRGTVIVYNWEGLGSVSANLSTVLADGATYEIIDTARMDSYLAGEATANWGQTGTFDSGSPSVSITMSARDLPPLRDLASDPNYDGNGGADTLSDPVSLPATFGAFLVKTTS